MYQSKIGKFGDEWTYTDLYISIPPKYIFSISASANWGFGSARGIGFSLNSEENFLEKNLISFKTVTTDYDEVSCTLSGYNISDEEKKYYVFAKYTSGYNDKDNTIIVSGFRIKVL